MDRGTRTPQIAAKLPGSDEKNHKLLMQAVMLSEGAQAELRRARKARAEAEQIRERAEAEKSQAIDEAFASVRAKAKALMDEAAAARSAAEADRNQAREERKRAESLRESAESLKEETKRACVKMESESKELAEQVVNEERTRVRTQIAEMEIQAEDEMRRLLADIEALHTAAQDEVNAQRLLTGAAQLRAGSSDLNLLGEQENGAVGQSGENEASGPGQAGATGSSVATDPGPATSGTELLAGLAIAGASQTNGHVRQASKPGKRTAKRGGGNGAKKRA